MLIFFGIIILAVVISIPIFPFAGEPNVISLALSFSTFFLCLIFLSRTEQCRQIIVFNTYGSWGYYFTDTTTRKTIYSFSEREFSLSQSKKWLRSIWNIMALFRMELVQTDRVSYSNFLRQLSTNANINPGLQGELMGVAYCLCCRLAKAEGREDPGLFAELALSTFATQLCNAIWTDYTRTVGGVSNMHATNAEIIPGRVSIS